MKKLSYAAWLVRGLRTMPMLVLTFCSAVLAFALLQGWRIFSVQTGSMIPVFWPGDAIIVRPLQPKDLRVGMVISYRTRHNPKVVISHRIVALQSGSNPLITEGDNATMIDMPVSQQQVIGKAVRVLPHYGRILEWFRSPGGLVCGVYVPAALIIGRQMLRYHQRRETFIYKLRQW